MGSKSRTQTAGNKYMFLTIGFEPPTPEQMGAWGAWFKSIDDRMVDQGGFWAGGTEFTQGGSTALPFGKDSITGFVIFRAKDQDEAEALAAACPIVASNRVYEIKTK